MRDTVRSVYQCESTHGSYTRCILNENHSGPHHNGSYDWDDPKGEQSGGTTSVMEPKDQKEHWWTPGSDTKGE